MQPSVLLSGTALVLAAAALAIALSDDPAPDDDGSPRSATTASSSDAPAGATTRGRAASREEALSRRVARLEADIAMLRRALQRTQGAPVPPPAAETDAPTLDGQAAEAAVVEAIETAPEVSARIEQLVEDKMDARREARWARRAERVAEQDAVMIQSVREQHTVEDDDAEQIGRLLAAEREQVFAAFRQAREGGGWREARERVSVIAEETDGNVAALLDDEAFATWSALREERASRWGGGRSGRQRGERTTDDTQPR